MKQVKLTYLNKGNISYEDALAFQQEVRKIIIELKQLKIDTSANNLLILCEHQPILTFGSSAKESELFIPRGKLSDVGLDHLDIRRGGAITFHGEGQLVGYPVYNLNDQMVLYEM
ncbi:hypothetical protein FAZ15_17185 [Sphingobacterium olei]|uniref:BPL/LPL catalytic domain-containing protein n=1 Tax=Sphingobacterium olei TaxID=2571155 RepID=A0A4V5MML4_9SPHI|nr:hypothetical protein [Sphingobacterium olei]TJZ53758.1 hypothetical protein FAZ15_17185 [Sphingobacterium olei]